MATIQKRVGRNGDTVYRVQIRLKGFSPESASFERLTDAKAWAAKTETDIRAGRHFGQAKRRTFNDLADEYQKYAKDVTRLNYWRSVFGRDLLDTITPARIGKARDKLLSEETTRFKTPATGNANLDAKRERSLRTGSTVNRYLASLSSCLAYGVKEHGWIERNPCERVKKPKESEGRVRFLADDERHRLIHACRPHPDLYLAVILSLTTGARQAEIMTLQWSQIDFAHHVIQLTKTKNNDRRAVPLVGEAFSLLQARGKVRSLKDNRVFPPTARAKKANCLDLRAPWETALEAANIKDFHWHDLRHTAASFMVMNGVSLVELAKVLGHRTLQMVLRYSHLLEGHIVATGQKLADRLGVGE
jgi:integrase